MRIKKEILAISIFKENKMRVFISLFLFCSLLVWPVSLKARARKAIVANVVSLPFIDTFEDGDLNGWTITDVEVKASTENPKFGNWSMKLYDRTTSPIGTEVKLTLNTTSSRIGLEFYEWTNDFGWNGGSSYSLEATTNLSSGWGFLFGANTHTEGKWRFINSQNKAEWASTNPWLDMDKDLPTPVPAKENSWHKIKIEIYGPEGKAKFWYDGGFKGEIRIKPTTQPLKYFTHGISWSAPTTTINYIDNFRAYEITTHPPSRVLFDDFDYKSWYELFVLSEWTGSDGNKHLRDMYCGNDPGSLKVKVGIFDNNSVVRLNLDSSMKGVGSKDNNTPMLATLQYYNEGIYAARVWFDDNPTLLKDKIVETFWIQSSYQEEANEAYAECDFEYLPYDFWAWEGILNRRPAMYRNTWDRVVPAIKDKDIRRRYKASLGGKWVGLMMIVKKENSVEYLIYDCSMTTPILLNSYFMDKKNLAPESKSMMKIMFNMWIEKDSRTKRSYGMKVDWMIHIQNETSYDFFDINNFVNQFRKNNITRIDTTVPLKKG